MKSLKTFLIMGAITAMGFRASDRYYRGSSSPIPANFINKRGYKNKKRKKK